MAGYNIMEWYNGYENDKIKFDFSSDVIESKQRLLLPGRFYILEYISNTDKPYNTRPIILSLGPSKEDKHKFICIDLCVIPLKIRLRFIEMFFKIFASDIEKTMDKNWAPEDADKQDMIKSFSYEALSKAAPMIPLKCALKNYKLENVRRIYSVPFSGVYKIIGRLADENYYQNGKLITAQNNFIVNVRKRT